MSNTTLKIARGTKSKMPTLADGQQYLCTDTRETFIGLKGNNIPVVPPVETKYQISATYAELVALIKSRSLKPGMQYLMTDYQTKYQQPVTLTLKTSSIERLVLTAISTNLFDRQCSSIDYPQDIIWYDFNNNKCEDDITPRNGFIMRRHDTIKNLNAPHDWRTMEWKRNEPLEGYDITFRPNCHDIYIGDLENYVLMNNVFESNCAYITLGNGCNDNRFSPGCAYITFGNNCYNNKFGDGCCNNTFGDVCYNNTFGELSGNNTFGGKCSHNIFWIECSNNTFGDDCSHNTFENGCMNNVFRNACMNITFGNNCNSNTFEDGCSDNTFGDDCLSNTLEDHCVKNTFENECLSNTLEDHCVKNTFGAMSKYNTFSSFCSNNRFSSGCSDNTLGNACSYNELGTKFVFIIAEHRSLNNKNISAILQFKDLNYTKYIERNKSGYSVYRVPGENNQPVYTAIP